MITSGVVSDVRSYTIVESLTIDEGSQYVQRFDKPVSRARQRLH